MLCRKRQVISDGYKEDMTNNIGDTPHFFSRLHLMNNESNFKKSCMQDDHDKVIWIEDLSKQKI